MWDQEKCPEGKGNRFLSLFLSRPKKENMYVHVKRDNFGISQLSPKVLMRSTLKNFYRVAKINIPKQGNVSFHRKS